MITLASYVTIIRILLTPVVACYIHQAQWLWAVLFFIVAAATDLVDGFIARRFNQQSSLGQILDPIADKCLIMTTLYALLMVVAGTFWQRIFVWCLLAKEAILLIGGGWLKLRYNLFIAPSKLSRAASLAEILLILFLFASLVFSWNISPTIFSILLSGNLLLSVWLLVRYSRIVVMIFKNHQL